MKLKAFFLGLCPRCPDGPPKGRLTHHLFFLHPRCPQCGKDLHPEPGFYLGAMMVSFLVLAILMIPPLVALKFLGASDQWIIAFPFIQLAVLGPWVSLYSRIGWIYLEERLTRRLDGPP